MPVSEMSLSQVLAAVLFVACIITGVIIGLMMTFNIQRGHPFHYYLLFSLFPTRVLTEKGRMYLRMSYYLAPVAIVAWMLMFVPLF